MTFLKVGKIFLLYNPTAFCISPMNFLIGLFWEEKKNFLIWDNSTHLHEFSDCLWNFLASICNFASKSVRIYLLSTTLLQKKHASEFFDCFEYVRLTITHIQGGTVLNLSVIFPPDSQLLKLKLSMHLHTLNKHNHNQHIGGNTE